MPSIFSRIIAGEIPSYKLAEDDNFIAFLDISPLVLGHALVVPKQEIDYIFDIDDDVLAAMLPFARKVGLAIEKVVPCERIGMAVVGLEVPHAHLHLVPLNQMSDLDFRKERVSVSPEDMKQLALEISQFID